METNDNDQNNRFADTVKHTKFRYSTDAENQAINNIVSFLNDEATWNNYSSNKVLCLVLRQLQGACSSITKDEDDDEHLGIQAFNSFLQEKIYSVEKTDEDVLAEKSILGIVNYLNDLKSQVADEPMAITITGRLNTFCNRLRSYTSDSWSAKYSKNMNLWGYGGLVFIIGLILELIGLPIIGGLCFLATLVLVIISFVRNMRLP